MTLLSTPPLTTASVSIQDAAQTPWVMAPSANPVSPLLSPKVTTTPPDDATSRSPTDTLTLATIPSDEDRSSEDGSHRSGSSRRERSDSSSISEPGNDELHRDTADIDSSDEYQHGESDGRGYTLNGGAQPTKPRSSSAATITKTQSHDNVQRLSAAEMQQLTSSPDSLPIAPAPHRRSLDQDQVARMSEQRDAIRQSMLQHPDLRAHEAIQVNGEATEGGMWHARDTIRRTVSSPRNLSTPPSTRGNQQPVDWPTSTTSPRRYSFQPSARPPSLHLNLDGPVGGNAGVISPNSAIQGTSPSATPHPLDQLAPPSPVPQMIPLPPTSLPTHLQLELAAGRPSPLYIHQSHTHVNDLPYESSAVKFERLLNVLLLPPFLERTLYFGALACLDAWLYTFTILPIRFFMALSVLVRWWAYVVAKEGRWVVDYVWYGLGRLWRRGRTGRFRSTSDVSDVMRSRSRSVASEASTDVDAGTTGVHRRPNRTGMDARANGNSHLKATQGHDPGPRTGSFRHRRTKSMPSSLSAFHKADLLQGAVILCSSVALMTLDASRMYHFIRAQSAIKLYVIYNILEVGDRLLSALGQDILECLFSTETLSRNALGRSKILLPLGMFLLALVYNCLHSITLYYQVITLNVAVNSYSNALLTLLLSNQFVEIKSTVFKRIEKDNLFQLTLADIVERFHLWIMLLIIGMRNVVEVGGLSVPGAGSDSLSDESASPGGLHDPSILPHSFTVLPSWLMSGEVLSPFLIVVGSEMLVDTIKHAYVTKFNNIKPTFYSRILDILCKDYYTNVSTYSNCPESFPR